MAYLSSSHVHHRITAGFSALVLLLTVCLCTACGNDSYSAAESTKEERTTIVTVGKYDVPYELFRALMITRRADAGLDDPAHWTDGNGDASWETVLPAVIDDISAIYAVFALCEKNGIDPMGDKVNDELDEQIRISVDGGMIGDVTVTGYGGSYDAYLAALAENHINDGAARLLIRYQICENMLLDKMTQPYTHAYDYTENDLRAFFTGGECFRAVLLYRENNTLGMTAEDNLHVAQNAVMNLRMATDETAIVNLCHQFFQNSDTDIRNGVYLTTHALNPQIYGDLLHSAASLEVGGISEPFAVATATQDFYYVVRRLSFDPAVYDTCAEEIEDLYLRDRLYKELEDLCKTLTDSLRYTSFYDTVYGSYIIYPETA